MYCLIISGRVQGVGFRPFIYRIAKENDLKGEITNEGYGVKIIVDKKSSILDALKTPPPLAKIHSVEIHKIAPGTYTSFTIKKSSKSKGKTLLPPDIYVCSNCLNELKNPKNRRYRYYFITCTDCGPRYSITEKLPYDRETTSMKDFQMCPECRKEYTNPADRRYHAQTIACPHCGPRLKLLDNKKKTIETSEEAAIKKAAELIKKNKSIGIKGIGGMHLVSNCTKNAVMQVRKLLKRPHKPFAVMFKDLSMLKKYAAPTKEETEEMKSPKSPIVIVKKKNEHMLKEVTELDSIGAMFPYTGLHYLLFDYLNEPLVFTSLNMPGEPISKEENLAEFFLTHERSIVNRCDDSVLKLIRGQPLLLRRSRGFVPTPIEISEQCRPTLALGGETNNTIALADKNRVYLSQHIGDCSNFKTINYLKETVKKFMQLTQIYPEIIATDMHPGYETNEFASELSRELNTKLVKVQHHKAHIAGVAAENNLKDYVGIACDGMGYGDDGTLWGGEVFRVNEGCFKRIGHLEPQFMIGGDSAAKFPKKMLFAILSKIMSEEELLKHDLFPENEARLYLKQLKQRFNVFATSSTGRVLDAVASLLGICDIATYEGRPAMLLESSSERSYKINPVIETRKGKKILMTTPLIEYLKENLSLNKQRLAATAQKYVAEGLYKIVKGEDLPIVFSGGVAYNRIITEYMLDKGVYLPKVVPAGDGGLCVGQCIIANQHLNISNDNTYQY
ncbi:MAG: carbamoyltransferase HypF [Nanoarchaeota archaeon]